MKVKKFLKFLRENGAQYKSNANGSHEKWILKGKPFIVTHKGYHCGCCGRWWDKEIRVPEYQKDKTPKEEFWSVCPDKCEAVERCEKF